MRPSVYISSSLNNSYVVLNEQVRSNQSTNINTNFSYNLNLKDKLDLTLSAAPSWQSSIIPSLQSKSTSINQTYAIEWWVAPFKRIWFDGKYTYRRQNFTSVHSVPTEFSLWNMAVTWLVMKENRGQLRLSVFDLLGQNRNTTRTSTVNELTYSYVNAVTRYYMLSFVYNFNSFHKPGREKRGFSFWY
ncbi:MAG: hypothetical protein GC180_08525 [Bacteroidetes bacterium]|nr:hypothetical protein [Bacteroidota bacterium]